MQKHFTGAVSQTEGGTGGSSDPPPGKTDKGVGDG